MAFWAYMLKCADGRYYVGQTDALERRVMLHQAGKGSDFTARRQPVMLVWSETFATRAEALAAELRIKGWSRAKKEALIAGDWNRVSELAVSHGARPSTSSGRTGGMEPTPETSSAPEISLTPETPFVLSEVEGRAPGTGTGTPPRQWSEK